MNRIEQRAVRQLNEEWVELIGRFDMDNLWKVRQRLNWLLELADVRQRPRLPLPYEAAEAACGLTG